MAPLYCALHSLITLGRPLDLAWLACCRLSVRNRVTKRTRVVWNSRCPKWNEEFRFLVHFPGAAAPALRHWAAAPQGECTVACLACGTIDCEEAD